MYTHVSKCKSDGWKEGREGGKEEGREEGKNVINTTPLKSLTEASIVEATGLDSDIWLQL
jgi:predicted transposase YdaD